ncbi:MAG: molecular chaperone (small heat shock protein) [Methanomicrobia archaeon]|jgi:HSP20 family protein|nr:molecular chaperone (small heat shock protein) [Methanomicrobia archaeon]MDD1639326.1 Hsp20/alpha crystallin family protein [Methanomicrobiales archaeon]MDD1644979.1 Hsp20/alpha crystallin family protein [Methanomicrobiales archaeon]
MVWRRYRPNSAVWNEFNELMQEMESQLSSLMEEVETTPLLPAREFRGRLIPAIRGDLRVDVREHDDEVVLVADLPGVEKDDVSIQLMDPRTIQISSERRLEEEEKAEGYYMRERRFGSMDRLIRLPASVTDKGGSASFKNGVLEVHLMKSPEERKKQIPIE